MSSDSDSDDFSYTNTAAIFKKITQKKTHENVENYSPDVSIVDNSITEQLNDSETINDIQEKSTKLDKNEDIVATYKEIDKPNVVTDKIEIVENEADKSFDIISAIDACLERSNSRGRRGTPRGRRGTARRRSSRTPTAIDACLEQSNSRGRRGTPIRQSLRIQTPIACGRPKRRGAQSSCNTTRGKKRGNKSPAANTRSKRIHNYQVIDSVEIDPDYPILNTVPSVSNEVNYEVTVKVLWKSQQLEKFEVKRFEKLEKIYQFYVEKENISEDRILFTLKDRVVSKTDTPYSLDLTAASILEGGTLSEKTYLSSGIEYSSDRISLKVLTKETKKPINITMKVTDQMEILFEQSAQVIQKPVSSLRFYFDGDIVKKSDTPISLALEGDECIDCVVT